MKTENNFKAIFASMVIVLGLAACDKPGSAETGGKKLDQVTENAANNFSNAAEKVDKALTKNKEAAAQAMEDAEITVKVKSALLNTPGLPSMKIGVATTSAVVTLSGSVENQESKEKAIKAAQGVRGVQSVKSELEVLK